MSINHSYIGRVGALAVFLGVGGAVVALSPTAAADSDPTKSPAQQSQGARSQSKGQSAAELAGPRSGRRSAVGAVKPGVAASTAFARRTAISDVDVNPLTWLAAGVDPAVPAATPFEWAAPSRRELSATIVARSAAVTTASAAALTSPLADPGVGTALLAAAGQVVLTLAAGENIGVALQGGVTSLAANPALTDVTVAEVLADPALGQTAGNVTTGLAADPTVRTAVGTLISDSVSAAEAILPGVAGLAAPVADAAVSLLGNPAAASGLGAVANSFVTTLVGQTGSTLTTVATELIAGLSGSDPSGALNAALNALAVDPGFRSGLGSAAGAALNAGLSNSGLVNAVIEGVATDPALLAAIANAIPGPFGATIAATLSDPAATSRLVNGFLAQDGVVAALSGTASAVLGDLVAGTPVPVALQTAFAALQSASAIQAALGNSIPFALGAFLTGQINLLPLPEFVRYALVVGATSLVNNPTVQDVVVVVSDKVINGGSLTDLVPTLIGSVVTSPALQMALGGAIGQGIGALFGDNPIGFIVGQLAGFAANIAVGTASGLVGLINLFVPGFLNSLLGGISNPAASVYPVNVVLASGTSR